MSPVLFDLAPKKLMLFEQDEELSFVELLSSTFLRRLSPRRVRARSFSSLPLFSSHRLSTLSQDEMYMLLTILPAPLHSGKIPGPFELEGEGVEGPGELPLLFTPSGEVNDLDMR